MTDLMTPQARKATANADVSPPFAAPYGFYGETDSIRLLECARLLYRDRRLIAAIVSIFTLLALTMALSLPPVYRAEVLLAPASHEKSDGPGALLGQLGDIAALVGSGIGNTKDRTAESIATLRSRSLAIEFIRDGNLKPVLFADQWDATRQAWHDPTKAPTDLDAYEMFDKRLRRVNVDRRNGLVTLAIEWSDPTLAAVWANRLVTEVNKRRRTEAIREAEQSIKYLQQQLGRTSSIETQQSIYRLIESNTKTIALANAREDYAFRVIDPAIRPERRIWPKRTLIVMAGAVGGGLIAVFVVFLRRAIARERGVATSVVRAG